MPIRVLHVVSSMDAGGIETMIMNLYRRINKQRIQFDFLVHRPHEGFYEDEIKSLGGRIYRMRPIRPCTIHKYFYELSKFFKGEAKYGIVHSHISVYSYIVLNIAKICEIKYRIAHSHESHNTIKEHRLFRRPIIVALKRLINKPVTHRFACSKDAGKWLFGKKHEFKVLCNSIDAHKYVFFEEKRKAKRRELNVEDRFIIGHIGNFSEAKNYPFIINVFKSVLEQNDKAILILIGKNNNNLEVEKKVNEMGLGDYVIFTGVRSDIPELLHAIDVFLFPSLYEGLPVTLIEAQASGLKIIASDTITEEVAITDNIEFVSLDKPAELWADRILQYQEGYDRRNTSEEITKAGYDVKDNAKWLENFYLEQHQRNY